MIHKSMNRDELHDQNLRLVLQQIFNNHPTSRIEISHQLDLNKSTVSSLYNTLMDRGFVSELGHGDASNAGGRKPTMVTINRQYGFTMTFDLGYHHLHAMANDLNANVLSYERIEMADHSLEEIIQTCEASIEQAIAGDATAHGLLGICFSIHGIIDHNRVTYTPFLSFQDVDFSKHFEDRFQVPVILENEANLSAIYERDFNGAHQVNSTVTFSVHHGLGAGIILNRGLYRGEHGEAGEIGRSLAPTGQNDVKHVEEICSEDALINQIEQLKHEENLDRNDIVALFKKNDHDTLGVLIHGAKVLAGVIYNMVTTFDPNAVFINSPLIEKIPEMLTWIQEDYQRYSLIEMPIKLTHNAQYATLLGGCSLITHHVLQMDNFDIYFTQTEDY
ncbi:ROK family protein [Levilactobacillus bambusae]|uniref:ROK family protein n=1 Tax=Levilactobacillus bambusae TaxID=2024736 RepID=A0A2V1MWR2_9LACO|nr:ROK family protein [Levilactobacillus bambusae]PWF99486.1 ROK family protein [Levilactobacillus bambusae]